MLLRSKAKGGYRTGGVAKRDVRGPDGEEQLLDTELHIKYLQSPRAGIPN